MNWRITLLGILTLLTAAAACYAAAGELMAPAAAAIAESPPGLRTRAVAMQSKSGSLIHGWFVPRNSSRGTVLLLHGIRANRLQMLSRARFLHDAGYSTLLIDLQAHGESPGRHITFGYLEARDVEAALQFLAQLDPDKPIGVIGISLGAAAFVLSENHPKVKAAVLEAVYTDFDSALANRLRIQFGYLGQLLAPLLKIQVQPRLGFHPGKLSPVARIGDLNAALLLVAGKEDRHTTLKQTRRLYKRAKKPKLLWEIEGAGHVDFYSNRPEEYKDRVLSFFTEYLTDSTT